MRKVSRAVTINETKLDLEPVFELSDKYTASLCFDSLYAVKGKTYTGKEFDALNIENKEDYIFTPFVEYWIDENKWKFILLYEYDNTEWEPSSEIRLFAQKKIAEGLCNYNQTGCSDCEFNWATEFNCPLGRE